MSGIIDDARLAGKKYLLGNRNTVCHYTIPCAFVFDIFIRKIENTLKITEKWTKFIKKDNSQNRNSQYMYLETINISIQNYIK